MEGREDAGDRELWLRRHGGCGTDSGRRGCGPQGTQPDPTGSPLILIDGRRATKAEMDALQPSGIISVEVLKGEAAVR
ncbi:MAG: hypothetical protein ACKORK_02970, partial [Gemmatimonadota bacterium]